MASNIAQPQKSPLRASLLGEQTAENDSKLLLPNYVETPEYRSVIETKDSSVIVGRRGTGKSAMFSKLIDFWGSQKSSNVIAVAPEDYQTISFRALFRPFEGKYSYVRSVSRLAWKYGFLMEMLCHLAKHFKTKDLVTKNRCVENHIRHWQVNQTDFFTRLITQLSPRIRRHAEVETIIGELHQELDLSNLESALIQFLDASNIRFYILTDKLDEGYENDETGAAIVSGAIAAISEINKRHDSVRSVIFQRDNILRAVQKYDPDYSRNIEGEVISLHWDTYQLQNLVAKRLNAVFAIGLENSQRIWDRCTANEAPDRELQGKEGFLKCLQFTLYRPRDLLSLLNQSFFSAARENRDKIVLSDIEKTAKSISATRLEDLKKEYISIIPSLPMAVSVFEQVNPEMTYAEAVSLLDGLPSMLKASDSTGPALQDYAILKSDGLVRALYSVGFLGTHDENSNTFSFCHDGRQPDREFIQRDRILVHPCYWIALNLSRNALGPGEAEQITDEYEIKVTSVSPMIRAQRIGSLIAELGNIDEGQEHASLFEDWLLTAIQTVFASHLSNIEKKPNGSAVQRRDIVGTNLAKSSLWCRIERDYGVRQVLFEAKNFKSTGRDEYRQMSSYLVNSYGRLGFLITRDDDENLRSGAELDWVREIYGNERKLIVRLTHKFFLRMLGKLRNPERHDVVDNSLSSLIDLYERRYLSLPTTRGKSKK